MFTKIVVLWMTYQFNFPTWCKALMIITVILDVIRIGGVLGKHVEIK